MVSYVKNTVVLRGACDGATKQWRWPAQGQGQVSSGMPCTALHCTALHCTRCPAQQQLQWWASYQPFGPGPTFLGTNTQPSEPQNPSLLKFEVTCCQKRVSAAALAVRRVNFRIDLPHRRLLVLKRHAKQHITCERSNTNKERAGLTRSLHAASPHALVYPEAHLCLPAVRPHRSCVSLG